MSNEMTSRRSFLSAAAFTAPSAAMAAASALAGDAGSAAAGRPLKVCVFADLHYLPRDYTNTDDMTFLERILARAEKERCDMVIHLGDFVEKLRRPNEQAFIKLYNDFRIPTYHILGNHDQDSCPYKETCDAYRMPDGHYTFDKGGFRFVIADPNYFCNEPGKFIHHENGNYYSRAKGSTINWIPPEQIEWMRSTIVGSPYPCIVLSHQSLERGHGSPVMNKAEVQAIFREANARKPGTVRLVMNGHMHVDHLRVLDNILYWDVNSANFWWCGKDHDKYPAKYLAEHRMASKILGWTDPLSAILTIWPDGRIKIDGSRAGWLFGVTPKDAGYPTIDVDGREILPVIQSADMKFAYA